MLPEWSCDIFHQIGVRLDILFLSGEVGPVLHSHHTEILFCGVFEDGIDESSENFYVLLRHEGVVAFDVLYQTLEGQFAEGFGC